MSGSDKPHLAERAAERLTRDGSAPIGLAERPVPPAAPPMTMAAAPMPVAAVTSMEPTDPTHRIDMPRLISAGVAEGGAGRTRIAEEFRLVQNQLLRAAFGTESDPGLSNLLMVTSARPNEGKTFSALNLATSIARRGDHQVLLIDADAKHGSLTDQLGLGDFPGLLELAAKTDFDLPDCVFSTAIPALSFLPVGHQRGHRGDVFASNGMMRVIQGLGRRFPDIFIVLDVAPCLSTSDPAALAPMVGQIIFVVEAERTQRDEVEASLDLIQTCPTITLLLNKVQMSTSHSFGAYSYSYAS